MIAGTREFGARFPDFKDQLVVIDGVALVCVMEQAMTRHTPAEECEEATVTGNRQLKAVFGLMVVLFGLFVLGYQGGKQLAKAENATRAQQQ